MALLDIIKDDALIDAAPALVPFLQNVVAAKGDPLKTMAAWIKFQGDITQAGVVLEGDLINQLGAVVMTRLTDLISKAEADLPGQLKAPLTPPPAQGVSTGPLG